MHRTLLFLTLLASGLSACAHRPAKNKSVYPPRYYKVQSGDTLDAVAEKFSVDLFKLAEANEITLNSPLAPGRNLFIPYSIERLRDLGEGPLGQAPSKLGVQLQWPLAQPKISDYFGWRRRKLHEGVDLQAKTGTEVWSAGQGEVLYVGRKMRGFGLMIVIDHGRDVSTVYAHLKKAFVSAGDRVEAGQVIAFSGRSGRVTGPHLHFELRIGSDPVDPLLYFPKL